MFLKEMALEPILQSNATACMLSEFGVFTKFDLPTESVQAGE